MDVFLALAPAVVVLVGVVITLKATSSRERCLRLLDLRAAAYFEYQLAVSDFLARMDEHDYKHTGRQGAPLLADGDFFDAPLRRELIRIEIYGSVAVRDGAREGIRMLRAAAGDRSEYDEGPLISVRNSMRQELGVS